MVALLLAAVIVSGTELLPQQLRSLIEAHQLDPATALAELMQLVGEEHRQGFYAVLTGFRAYSPHALSGLWLHGDRYRPEHWLEQWRNSLPAAAAATAAAA
ncbi:MAG: hypothetical protein ACKO6M_01905 [Bacteroidota bacterium]